MSDQDRARQNQPVKEARWLPNPSDDYAETIQAAARATSEADCREAIRSLAPWVLS